jgi:ribosome maturation factor RimP
VGRRAAVNALALHGRHEMEIVAVDGEAGQELLRLRDAKGIEHSIALADVTDARLAFHWKP